MIGARDIVKGLNGSWTRTSGMCRCPAHDDKSPSLSVSQTRDGRPLVFCHAGCSQLEVINALRSAGLWQGDAKHDPSYPGRMTVSHDGHKNKDDRDRQNYACDLWERADRIGGTLAATYLKSRGLSMIVWPDALGYLPSVPHKPSGKSFPCMVAAVTDGGGSVTAVQRTWLRSDGSGKADVSPAKMTVGPMGNGAVRLGNVTGTTMGLAEGVETALSASRLYLIPVWATLSANRLGKVHLPKQVETLTIFADTGEVGMASAIEAAEFYEGKGIKVDVIPPHVNFGPGYSDFNDIVQAGR